MFSTRSSCSCLASSCSPNPPLTPPQPLTFTAPTTKVHRSSLSHSPFYPCLPISNHDKPALFRRSCHCCCKKRQGVDGLRCSARLGPTAGAGRADPLDPPPRPNSPLVVCAPPWYGMCKDQAGCTTYYATQAALQRKPTSPAPNHSASAATADVHFCCRAQLTFVKHSYLGILAFLVSTANSVIWVGPKTLCEEKNVSAVDV